MTEQPAEPTTEQDWLGNIPQRQAYLPGGHRINYGLDAAAIGERTGRGIGALFAGAVDAAFDKAEAQVRELAAATKDPDLWFDAEQQTTRALTEIQNGNINAGVACLQAALAFAQNYRHSLTEESI